MDREGTDPIQRCFDESYARLVRQLYGVCGDRAEAEDVVAEAFVRAVSKRRTFERLDSPEAWLRTVAVNIARSRHRRKVLGEKLMFRSHDEEAAPRDAVDDRGDRLDVVAALRRLPQEQREALALHYLADLPVAEVAETVGAPVGTVKARLSRGRTALAAVMTADEQELAVDAPPYDDIERRGNRRRAVRQGVAAGTAGLAVVLVIVFAQSVVRSGGDAAPPPVAPSPTSTGDTAIDPIGVRGRAVDVAGAEDGTLAVMFDTGDWWELTTATSDGTESVEMPPGSSVDALPDGGYLVKRGQDGMKQVDILDDAGLQAMRMVSIDRQREPSPLLDGEVPFTLGGSHGFELELFALDPATAEAHLVPMDVGGDEIREATTYDGRLAVLTTEDGTSTYHWSDDGGESWSDESLDDTGFSSIVPTGAGEDHVVIEGRGGDELFPFLGVHTMPTSGGGFDRVGYDELPFTDYYFGGYVEDGGLVVAAQLGGGGSSSTEGTFAYADGELRQVGDFPASEILSVEPDGTIWMADSVSLLRSTDDGRTWESFSHDPDEEPTTPEPGPSAGPEAIVAHPEARLAELRLDPESQAALAVWECDRACGEVRGTALVATTDRFANTRVLPFEGRATVVESLGDGAFLVRGNRGLGEVVRADGGREPVVEGDTGGAGSPVIVWQGANRSLYLVDGATATAQLVDQPATPYQVLDLPDGLIALQTELGVLTSADRGQTWRAVEASPETQSDSLLSLVPAGTSDVVLVEGGDGASVLPFEAVQYADDGRFVRVAQDTTPMRYTGGQAVLPDGRMLVFVESWSSGDDPAGYYLSDGEDWATFEYLGGPPADTVGYGAGGPLDFAVTDDSLTVVAQGVGPEVPAWISTDAGESWQPLEAR